MSDDDNFLVFATVGFVLMFAGGSYRPMLKKYTEAKLLKVGVVLMIVGLAGLGGVAYGSTMQSATNDKVEIPGLKVYFYIAMSLAVIGFAFVNPSVSALVSKRSDPARQGEVMGVNQSFASLGRILGPLLGSILFQMNASGTLPFALAVGLLAVVLMLLPRLKTS